MDDANATEAPPSKGLLLSAIVTVVFLIVLLGLSVFLFGDEATGGPTQFAIAFAATFAAILVRFQGMSWEKIAEAVKDGVAIAIQAMFILLAVGALIGTWAMSGTIVAMMYYGLEILNLEFFYVSALVISAVIAISIGSSWTVAGTLGVGLIGMAQGVGLSPAVTAGAIICGAYFGDKTSPLSDSVNLASAVSESKLITHIRYCLRTSIPTLIVTLIGFLIIDLTESRQVSETEIVQVQSTLAATFNVSLWGLSPLALVLILVILRVGPFVSIMTGALFGGVMAVVLQPGLVLSFAQDPDLPTWLTMLKAVWYALSSGYEINTGVAEMDSLLSRGGMGSMMGTIWLILTALGFGAIMEHSGMLNALIRPMIAFATSTGRLFLSVAVTAFGINVLAADQYIATALPGRVFGREFKRRGLAPENLSRLINDSATVTSVLVPWNTCGAYMAATLGVSAWAFMPFCFFNIANPIISILVGAFGIGIAKVAVDTTEPSAESTEAPKENDAEGAVEAKST